eukprot:12305156-Karenia_brevis.AAC.1
MGRLWLLRRLFTISSGSTLFEGAPPSLQAGQTCQSSSSSHENMQSHGIKVKMSHVTMMEE